VIEVGVKLLNGRSLREVVFLSMNKRSIYKDVVHVVVPPPLLVVVPHNLSFVEVEFPGSQET